MSINNNKEIYPGTASLISQLDHKILTVLRDGRLLIGILISFDTFCKIIIKIVHQV